MKRKKTDKQVVQQASKLYHELMYVYCAGDCRYGAGLCKFEKRCDIICNAAGFLPAE